MASIQIGRASRAKARREDLTERFGREARDPCEVTQVSWKRSTDKKTADSSRRVIASGRIGDEARKLGHATAA